MEIQRSEQDSTQRLERWLDLLENRLLILNQICEPEGLKASEREMAISRHLATLVRLLQLYQRSARNDGSDKEQQVVQTLLQELERLQDPPSS